MNYPTCPKFRTGWPRARIWPRASRLAAYEAALDAQDRVAEYLDRCGTMGVAVAFDHALADRARESQPIGRLSDGTILYAHPRRRGRAPRAELREGAWILVDVFATEEGGYPIFPGRLPQPPPGWRTPAEEEGEGPWDVAYPPDTLGG